ncbi:MAG: UDP-3-O-[3-hydroxymyristoyl] N-acetylglucosamine deacetylase [Verrucomicrobia bacterium]|nr:UDP-3-O-[3-hydroxymyristoyl] N-acetylglucosamine deacetylase [Verrucomicrobiota bacterium]
MSLKQQTIKNTIEFSGKGLFTGQMASVRLCPAAPGSGISFRRTDLPNAPLIPAHIDFVKSDVRCTRLEQGAASVQTVEHLLAAFKGLNIDNVLVEISGPEVPIFDGSAKPFVEYFLKSGIEEQTEDRAEFSLKAPVSWSEGDVHLIAVPSDRFQVSYTLHYPTSPYLRTQFYTFICEPEVFAKEIAPCRTFALYEEIAPLIAIGRLKDAGLENGVVIQGDRVLNPEGVRFPDEMVRHKILDLIGDLSLVGKSIKAHIIALRSGHRAHQAFAKQILSELNAT